MGDLRTQILLIFISVGLSTLITLTITLVTRWLEQRQTRLLVASEIIANSTKLYLLVKSLEGNEDHNKQNRLGYCLQFDKVVTYNPDWQRERWLAVRPGAFSAEQLYPIDDWYSNLNGLTHALKDMAVQSAQYREWHDQVSPEERKRNDELLVSKLSELEKVMHDLHARPRPYIDRRIDAAHQRLLTGPQVVGDTPN